jgi:hypothetical protein
MTRVKILLTFIVVCGVVGGVLAFKVNSKRGPMWCTTSTVGGTCPTTLLCGTYTPFRTGNVPVCYTPTFSTNCRALRCPFYTRFTVQV